MASAGILLLAMNAGLCILAAAVLAEGPGLSSVNVYVGGRGGYHTYRIPALVATPAGRMLVFCEGRRRGQGDAGDIDLLLKRSSDGGETWSEQIAVVKEKGDEETTIGNPCPIVDGRTQIVHLLFTRNNERIFHVSSSDDGRTWSKPKEWTAILRMFDYQAVRVGTGPGHGIQMKSGRLVAPAWLSDRRLGENKEDSRKSRYRSGIIYSDDAGETWQAGGLVPPEINRLNEGTVIEAEGGRLVLNMRGQGVGFRAKATSGDGGMTWTSPRVMTDLPCPTCQASMFRLADAEIIFANPALSAEGDYAPGSRRNLTVRLSNDEGKTRARSRILNPGFSGYSDLAVLPDGTILCLFECGEENYRERIVLARFSRAWILENGSGDGR